MADLLPSEDFTKLTGRTVSDSGRYTALLGVAVGELEKALGWPLDPSSWDDQYLETGKAASDSACPNVDTDNLDPPDEVVGQTRLFPFVQGVKYLAIDPATAIHAVKLVYDDVTCRTLDAGDYRPHWVNGNPRIVKYLQLSGDCLTIVQTWESNCGLQNVMLAVDADWAYETTGEGDSEVYGLPQELKKVLADFVAWEADSAKKGITSESLIDHSYSKKDDGTDNPAVLHAKLLEHYAGPNGLMKRRRVGTGRQR